MPFQLHKGLYLLNEKRGTAMPRSELEVLGKPVRTNVVIAAHAICVRTTMPSLCVIEKFPRFPIHKISITLLQLF